jgi:hypothetical protein
MPHMKKTSSQSIIPVALYFFGSREHDAFASREPSMGTAPMSLSYIFLVLLTLLFQHSNMSTTMTEERWPTPEGFIPTYHCDVCYNVMKIEDVFKMKLCGHLFHFRCVSLFHSYSNYGCPTCKVECDWDDIMIVGSIDKKAMASVHEEMRHIEDDREMPLQSGEQELPTEPMDEEIELPSNMTKVLDVFYEEGMFELNELYAVAFTSEIDGQILQHDDGSTISVIRVDV